ncbi:CDP-glycerol glycerophosphotransferase family protein [Rhodococcus qingshengii]|nr:CDP-glycerol glycerophosphotransferase family protein [Rhodococcus qingshengii]
MAREILIGVYLFVFKIIYSLFYFCAVQKKITFVISFEENNRFLYRELIKQDPSMDMIILHKGKISKGFQKLLTQNTKTIHFTKNVKNWITAVYHISTSKVIIVDNYYGFLAAMRFKENVECIQIWHAAGALKTFGFADKSTLTRSKRANKRFKRVYSKFHKIVVGSEKMAEIYFDAFDAAPENILRTGIPRTDFFFNKKKMAERRAKVLKKYPSFEGKKIIMYAPTFRNGLMNDDQMPLDVEKMYMEFKDEHLLLIKTHPSVNNSNRYEEKYPEFAYNLSSYKRVNDLLVVADYLITDYSSIPFEYAILQKPMIFFDYDYEQYKRERGLIPDYKKIVPGPIAYNTEQIAKIIQENNFNMDQIREFSLDWNTYSDGHSSKRLAGYVVQRINQ